MTELNDAGQQSVRELGDALADIAEIAEAPVIDVDSFRAALAKLRFAIVATRARSIEATADSMNGNGPETLARNVELYSGERDIEGFALYIVAPKPTIAFGADVVLELEEFLHPERGPAARFHLLAERGERRRAMAGLRRMVRDDGIHWEARMRAALCLSALRARDAARLWEELRDCAERAADDDWAMSMQEVDWSREKAARRAREEAQWEREQAREEGAG